MAKKNKKFRARSAIFCYVLLLILAGVPLIAPLIIWFLPAPLLFLWLQNERSRVFMISFTAFLLAFFGGSLVYLTIPILLALLIAFTTGETAMRGDDSVKPLALGTLVLVSISILMMGIAYLNGSSIPIELGQQIQGFILHDPILQSTFSSAELHSIATEYMQTFIETIPSILVIVCFLIVFLNFIIARFTIRRKDPSRLQHAGLSSWKLPKGFAALSFFILLASFMPFSDTSQGLHVIIDNLLLLSSFFLALQGLSLIWRALSRYDKGKYVMLLVFALCFVRIVWSFYSILGFFDILYIKKTESRR